MRVLLLLSDVTKVTPAQSAALERDPVVSRVVISDHIRDTPEVDLVILEGIVTAERFMPRLRSNPRPFIVVAHLSTSAQRVALLDEGADVVLHGDVADDELLAQIRAVARRTAASLHTQPPASRSADRSRDGSPARRHTRSTNPPHASGGQSSRRIPGPPERGDEWTGTPHQRRRCSHRCSFHRVRLYPTPPNQGRTRPLPPRLHLHRMGRRLRLPAGRRSLNLATDFRRKDAACIAPEGTTGLCPSWPASSPAPSTGS